MEARPAAAAGRQWHPYSAGQEGRGREARLPEVRLEVHVLDHPLPLVDLAAHLEDLCLAACAAAATWPQVDHRVGPEAAFPVVVRLWVEQPSVGREEVLPEEQLLVAFQVEDL